MVSAGSLASVVGLGCVVTTVIVLSTVLPKDAAPATNSTTVAPTTADSNSTATSATTVVLTNATSASTQAPTTTGAVQAAVQDLEDQILAITGNVTLVQSSTNTSTVMQYLVPVSVQNTTLLTTLTGDVYSFYNDTSTAVGNGTDLDDVTEAALENVNYLLLTFTTPVAATNVSTSYNEVRLTGAQVEPIFDLVDSVVSANENYTATVNVLNGLVAALGTVEEDTTFETDTFTAMVQLIDLDNPADISSSWMADGSSRRRRDLSWLADSSQGSCGYWGWDFSFLY